MAVPTSPLRASPLPSPRPSGHTRPPCTQMADLQPHLRSHSPAPAVQTHLEPRSPFCPQPPVPLRGRALPARTRGLPPHLWSGLSVLFGSWKEEKEEGKHFGFYKVKEFIS